MLESAKNQDAINILKADHNNVKKLFDRFEGAESQDEREQIAATVIEELKTHTAVEEEIFYPAAREAVKGDLMNEADEEHHVAKLLVAELENMDIEDEHYAAKFKVLSENVRHHIKEEEGEMFPQVKDADLDLDALGQELLERKQELQRESFPTLPEQKMVDNVSRSASSSRPRRGSRQAGRSRAQSQHRHRDGHDADRGARS